MREDRGLRHTKCFRCGAEIVRTATQLSGHDRHFCSRQCQIAQVKTEGWRAEGFIDKRRPAHSMGFGFESRLSRFLGDK